MNGFYTQYIEPFAMQILGLSAWLAILCIIFIPLERLIPLHRRPFARKQVWADFGYYFVSGIVPALLMAVPLSIVAWVGHALVPWRILHAVETAPFWARALMALMATEIGYYWGHRWTHTIPFLWQFHAVHHSPREIDFLVSTHAHPIDTAFSHMCSMIPVYALGIAAPASESGSLIVILVNLVGQCWGFFLHANIRLRMGAFEWVFASPAFHHWHHNLGPPVDRNFSSMLPWLDRIFGTYHLPKDQWPPAYGIQNPLPQSMSRQLIGPLRGAWPSPAG